MCIDGFESLLASLGFYVLGGDIILWFVELVEWVICCKVQNTNRQTRVKVIA